MTTFLDIPNDIQRKIFTYMKYHLPVLRIVCKQWYQILKQSKIHPYLILYNLAKSGHVDILKWLYSKKYPFTSYAHIGAAEGGYVEILQWLHNQNLVYSQDEEIFSAAARGGYLAVLNWLWEHKYEWNFRACTAAARKGHLEAIIWLRQKSCPWNESTARFTLEAGHVEVFKWLLDNHCPCYNDTCMSWAIKNNYLEIVKYMYDKNPSFCVMQNIITEATKLGYTQMLEWILN